MPRYYTDQLLADLGDRLPDNNAGLITPEALRSVLTDIVQSLRPAYVALIGNHTTTPLAVPLTAGWIPLAGASLYTVAMGSNDQELAFDVAAGAVVAQFGDFVHFLDATISFTGQSNVEYQFAFGKNGVAEGAPVTIDGAGSQRIVLASGRSAKLPLVVGDQYQILARSPTGNSAIEIHNIEFIGELQTTRYP